MNDTYLFESKIINLLRNSANSKSIKEYSIMLNLLICFFSQSPGDYLKSPISSVFLPGKSIQSQRVPKRAYNINTSSRFQSSYIQAILGWFLKYFPSPQIQKPALHSPINILQNFRWILLKIKINRTRAFKISASKLTWHPHNTYIKTAVATTLGLILIVQKWRVDRGGEHRHFMLSYIYKYLYIYYHKWHLDIHSLTPTLNVSL